MTQTLQNKGIKATFSIRIIMKDHRELKYSLRVRLHPSLTEMVGERSNPKTTNHHPKVVATMNNRMRLPTKQLGSSNRRKMKGSI